jgi:hypothetical protein
MTDSTASPVATSSAAPERMALLHTLAFTAARLCAAQLGEFTTRVVSALSALETQDLSAEEGELCRHARAHLEGQRAAFERFVSDCLQQMLLQAVQAAVEQATARPESGAMDLSLITFEAMERKVLVDNLSQAIDRLHADVLTALSLRIAHWMQSESLGLAQNPFRSEVFLKAVAAAWSKFDALDASYRIVMRQMRPEVFLRLDEVWKALNDELVAHHVLPDIERTYRQRITERELAPSPSVTDRLRAWLAPEGTLNLIEPRAAALLEKMAAHVLRNQVIPARARELLGRLQAPLSRLAIEDKEFFFDDRHPARRLLQALIDASLGCNESSSGAEPLCRMIEQIVERAQDDTDFGQMRKDLEAFIRSEDGRLAARLREQVTAATREEDRRHAQRLAENDIVARIENGEVAGFLETFLQTQWQRVLTFAYSVRDAHPEVLPKVLAVMDDLIWSVQPKSAAEERRELVQRLAPMLAVLNAWLNVVKWAGAERDTFFSTLADHHAAAIRAPASMTARDQLERRMDIVQKASEHQLTRRAQEQQQAALAEFMPLVDRLGPGHWVELVRNNGTRVNCRVMWVSRARSRFVFSAPQTQLVFTLGDEALAQALRADRASVIRPNAVLGRALVAALEELGVK